jgi:DNA-binding MarR family transcriptional regulator
MGNYAADLVRPRAFISSAPGNSFDLTNDFSQTKLSAMDKLIRDIQTCYPQIYFACHTEHRTRHGSTDGLTDRDSAVLAHVRASDGQSAAALAKHLGIGASTLSATLKRLHGLGLVAMSASPTDARKRQIFLTAKGEDLLSARSVLDAARLRDLLSTLTKEEQRRAVDGLALLADGARRMREKDRR